MKDALGVAKRNFRSLLDLIQTAGHEDGFDPEYRNVGRERAVDRIDVTGFKVRRGFERNAQKRRVTRRVDEYARLVKRPVDGPLDGFGLFDGLVPRELF